MSVLLHSSVDVPHSGFDQWVDVESDVPSNRPNRRDGLARDLELAFDTVAETWWEQAKAMNAEPSAAIAHTPAAAPNESDYGLMLAWSKLVGDWTQEDAETLVICDDPWLFRHLALLPGVQAGAAPGLFKRRLKGLLRGFAARLYTAQRLARAALACRGQRRNQKPGGAVLLAYGHPASDANGKDAYFGPLMGELPHLTRMLHGDCPLGRAKELGQDGRTFAIHGWGSVLYALFVLPLAYWKPRSTDWLIKRAAHIEASGAGGAAMAWQLHCQKRWLKAVKPQTVAWPWENHAWERAFVRAAKAQGVHTIGYQHSVIGKQGLNYAPHSMPDGIKGLPHEIYTNGEATRAHLVHWGVPEDRVHVGGAFRVPAGDAAPYDPDAPVFLALPFEHRVCAQIIDAARADAKASGRRYLAKVHPMTPYLFEPGDGIDKTDVQLGQQPGVSAVVYAVTTVGLEALLMGLPTFRFQPEGVLAIDIAPRGIDLPTIDAGTVTAKLDDAQPPTPPDRRMLFAPVDLDLWRRLLDPQRPLS